MAGNSCYNCKWYLARRSGGYDNPPEPAECTRPGNEQCSTLTTFPFRGGCKLWGSQLPPPPAPVNHRGVVIFASVNRRSGAVRYRIPFVVRGVVFVDYESVKGCIDAWYAAGCPDLDGEGNSDAAEEV